VGADGLDDVAQDERDLGAARRPAGARITATGLPVVAS
jgi:hypothetical protein